MTLPSAHPSRLPRSESRRSVARSGLAAAGALALSAPVALAAPYALPAPVAWDSVNAAVNNTTLAATGTVGDRNYNVFDGFTTTIGLPIGNATNAEYVDVLVLNGSTVTSSSVFVGDNANSLGNFSLVIDNATLSATGTNNANIRLGSKSSNNSLYIQNGGTLDVTGSHFNGNGNDGYVNNNIVVHGAGSQFNSVQDLYVVYSGSTLGGTGSLSVENGGHVTIGAANDTTNRRLRIRHGYNSAITVTGATSKIDAYGTVTLGELTVATENNKLVLEDGGSLWIHNVTNQAAPLTWAKKSGGIDHQIDLGEGFLVVKGNQVNNTTITALIHADNGSGYAAGVMGTATWNGAAFGFTSSGDPGNYYAFYVDGSAGQSFLVGGVDTAGYTVFTNFAVIPEPGVLALVAVGSAMIVGRRRD